LRGLRIVAERPHDEGGASVAGGCDVNGDHIPDLVVGAPYADHHGTDSGSAFVVYGRRKPSTISLSHLGRGGFRIDGAHRHAHASSVVGLLRTGRRHPRCLVLVEDATPTSGAPTIQPPRGPAYALAPRRPGSVTRLPALGRDDLRVSGRRPGAPGRVPGPPGPPDGLPLPPQPTAVAVPAGDFNGDGHEDVLVSDPQLDRVLVELLP
jgi:hypothetical protein